MALLAPWRAASEITCIRKTATPISTVPIMSVKSTEVVITASAKLPPRRRRLHNRYRMAASSPTRRVTLPVSANESHHHGALHWHVAGNEISAEGPTDDRVEGVTDRHR